jgi:heme/copper-type cytochrome/quinol oxidase subunit 3
LSSGVSITWAHRSILAANRSHTIIALAITIGLGLIFTVCQAFEYYSAPFSINDGVYGSIFYMTTGFHGFHVLVGTIFLLVGL